MERHEEKYLIDYRQYAILKDRATKVLIPDTHGGSYTVTSLYFDDVMDTALLEKQNGLARHTKFRVRTYDGDDGFIKLERKVKQGILTQKQTAAITREQIPFLGVETDPFDGIAKDLAIQILSENLRPAIAVQYQRDAFYFQGTDFRLTFDTDLRILPPSVESLFSKNTPGIPVLNKNTVIMEIKYGSHLPAFIRNLTAVPATQLSVSKYALCREKIM